MVLFLAATRGGGGARPVWMRSLIGRSLPSPSLRRVSDGLSWGIAQRQLSMFYRGGLAVGARVPKLDLVAQPVIPAFSW